VSGEQEVDRVAFDAFTLALRVVLHAYDVNVPATEFERPWRLLREIAGGEVTLTSTAELAARFPAMSEFLYERGLGESL
jgi:hypothetical protein